MRRLVARDGGVAPGVEQICAVAPCRVDRDRLLIVDLARPPNDEEAIMLVTDCLIDEELEAQQS